MKNSVMKKLPVLVVLAAFVVSSAPALAYTAVGSVIIQYGFDYTEGTVSSQNGGVVNNDTLFADSAHNHAADGAVAAGSGNGGTYSLDIPPASRRQFTTGVGSLNTSVGNAIRSSGLGFISNDEVFAAGGLTMEVWIKNDGINAWAEGMTIMSIGGTFDMKIHNGRICLQDGYDGDYIGAAIDGSKWTHVAGVLTANTASGVSAMTLFVNGVQQTTSSYAQTTPFLNRFVGIGSGQGDAPHAPYNECSGLIYEPRISLGVLPPSQFTCVPVDPVALLAGNKEQSVAKSVVYETVCDRMWVWAVDASFDWPAHEDGETPGKNRMTPVEGAAYLGVPNVMFIQYQGIPAAPFQQYYTPFKAMKQVYWTLSNNGNQAHELGKEQEHVYQLAADNPNITGLLLDDFLTGPFAPNDDPHWLAANNAAFPVSLVLSLPQEVTADSLLLTQTAWTGGGYRTAKVAVDVSQDGTNWREVATGELPDEAGATRKLAFPEQPLGFLRVRVLSTHDTQAAMSCGLKALALFRKEQTVSLTGTQFRASSEYPSHEAMKLHLPRVAADGGAQIFTSQVSPRDLAVAKRRMQAIGGRKLDLAVVVYSHQIDQGIVPILKDVDTVLLWTWQSGELKNLEANFRRLKEILPGKKVFLGCYLWDFSLPTRTIPIELMEHQCELGLKWLRAGEIEGMIFLCNNIMDKNLKAVEWTREWIARVGDEKRK